MSDTTSPDPDNQHYRIRRGASSAFASAQDIWREKLWLRLAAYLLGAVLIMWVVLWATLLRGLPDAKSLLDYEPPLPTVVRGGDGEIVHSYARERRVQLQFADLPETLVNAYLAAEDRLFWSHGGVDVTGLAGAVIDYFRKIGSGTRARGGSTITQQVAKNILVGDEYSITRKLKEMVLARRIEDVLTKRQILELYLNEIALGRQSFGVQAAARAYFDKDVAELALHEAAFLAILPKAPERYGRAQHADLALARRNYVLDQMVRNNFASAAEAAQAKAMPLGLMANRSERRSVDAGYFLEEVRRELITRYGEKAEDGPHSVYAGGLWVRTSLDVEMQNAARDALRSGLLRYHGNRGWYGPIATIDLSKGNWRGQLVSSYLSINHMDWRVGVVTERSGSQAKIGFTDGKEYPLSGLPDALRAGHVIAASPQGNGYQVRTVPEVSGGFVAMDPIRGRVLAMQGGFDSRLSDFNRATQAKRQPGSTIKPFVYSTALDYGMTPATMVSDGSFCVYQGARLGEKCFRNFGGGGGGLHTMRWGLEQSRNLMTVHIANDTGMDRVATTFNELGIGKYEPYLSFALGAGDTTVLRMVNAYSVLVNSGRQFEPSLIDYVQDRKGKVMWRADKRECTNCNMAQWDGKPMPRFLPRGKQVMDARTAYQTLHMLEGVVQRGTATRLRDLDIPMFGKTGTSSGPTNAWFIGGAPEIVAGVYIGFDKPRNMGGYVQGGNTAAPMFKQFVQATRSRWNGEPFRIPGGVRMVRINRLTGKRVLEGWPTDDPRAGIIWEAFKPDTEPRRATREDEIEAMREAILAQIRRGRAERERSTVSGTKEKADFVEEQGGIY